MPKIEHELKTIFSNKNCKTIGWKKSEKQIRLNTTLNVFETKRNQVICWINVAFVNKLCEQAVDSLSLPCFSILNDAEALLVTKAVQYQNNKEDL